MRKHTLISVVAALALLGTAACVGGTASKGEARVVVMPISGSSAASGAVSDVVESRYELVSARRYAKTARKLQAKSRAEEDIRKVSRKLDVDALVHGEFVKRGKRKYELRLSLRAGSSGAEFDSVTVKLRSKKLSQRDRSKIKKKLYMALSEVDTWEEEDNTRASRSGRTGESDDEERDRARKLRKKQQAKEMRKEREEERRARSRKSKRSSDEDDEDEVDDETDERVARSSKSSKSDRKKSRSSKSAKSDSKKSRSSKSSKTASRDRDEEPSRTKSKKSKKDESYKVITVRGDDGQAVDNESPF